MDLDVSKLDPQDALDLRTEIVRKFSDKKEFWIEMEKNKIKVTGLDS